MREGILLAALFALPSFAQAPKFEVASIKQAAAGVEGYRGGCHGINSVIPPAQQGVVPLGQCFIKGARLSHLISTAFNVPLINLKTGPDWIQRGDIWFDVQAKAEDPNNTTEKELLTMLQNLLVERFQLKFHPEAAEQTGSALTVAKGGSKLTVSESGAGGVQFVGPNGEVMPRPIPGQAVTMKALKFSIATLTNVLTLLGNGPVLDRTGLTGTYDFTLTWNENGGPALSTALREQLGLNLETAKVPIQTFVVDSAQMPIPN